MIQLQSITGEESACSEAVIMKGKYSMWHVGADSLLQGNCYKFQCDFYFIFLYLLKEREQIAHQTYFDCRRLPMQWPQHRFIRPHFFCHESISADSGVERGHCDIRKISGMLHTPHPNVKAPHFLWIKSGSQLGKSKTLINYCLLKWEWSEVLGRCQISHPLGFK